MSNTTPSVGFDSHSEHRGVDVASNDLTLPGLLQAMFDLNPQAVAVSRLEDGLLVEVNPEWQSLTGYSRDEAIGRTTLELGQWESEADRQRVLAPLMSGDQLDDVETVLTMRDDVPRMVRMSGRCITLQGQRLAIVYIRDVTAETMANEALKAGERVLAETHQQINRQVKLHAVTEAVARVGHWVRYRGEDVAHVSEGLAQILGLGSQTMVPFSALVEGIHQDDREIFLGAVRRMDGQTIEYRWRGEEGVTIWIRLRTYRQSQGAGSHADFGVVQEITGEKEALRAVSDQLAFIQRITSRAPGMVYELQHWADGQMRFLFVSAGAEQLLGLRDEDLLADPMCFFRRIDRSDLKRLHRVTQTATRSQSAWQCEFRIPLSDGSVRWLLGSAVPQKQTDESILWCGAVTDITSQKLALERLQESETRFRSLTQLSSDWYWEQDENFCFVRVDGSEDIANALPVSGYLGKPRWESGVSGVSEAAWQAHRAALQAHEVFHDFEMQRVMDDGRVMWVTISGAPVFDAQGTFKGYRGTGRDITARKAAEDEIERLAFYDPLTGLPNRRLLLDRLSQALEHSERRSSHGALLFIDLDNFKVLNDTLGHHQGDELLKQVATRLVQCVRGTDTVARLGGDEFVVMLEDIGEDPAYAGSQTESVGKKILAALNNDYVLGGQRHHSSPSIGVTLFFRHVDTLDELLKRADLAMYQAKAAGRNTLRFYDPRMQAAANARAVLEADMRKALDKQEFMLYYQPVVDEHSAMTGVEALVRWQHPERGMISPGEFIPVAEQTALILRLGHWVLQSACAQLVAWCQNPVTERLTMAVNVSARQFRQPEFTSQVLELLRSTGANPYRLKIELTESLLLNDMDDAIRKMGELRSIGVGFSLDDFGTGYSSLSYLKRLPLDQLKIDQSFVRDVLIDPNDAAIARTILNLAQSLDLGVVAEGVETEGQRDFLARNGCKAFQGYLFGRPVPVDQLILPTQ